MKRFAVVVLVLTGMLSFDAAFGEEAGAKSKGIPLYVTVTQSLSNEAGFDDVNGDLSVNSSTLKLRTGFYKSDRATVGMDIKYQFAEYDFHHRFVCPFISDSLFDEAHQISLDLLHLYQYSDQWSSFVDLGASAAYESGAGLSDAMDYSLTGVMLRKVNDKLTLGFGLNLRYDLTDDLSAFPLLIVQWQVNDRLLLELKEEARLSYVLSPANHLTGFLRAGLAEGLGPRKFRLDDDGGVRGGSVEFDGFSYGTGIRWQPVDRFSLTGYVNVAPGCEMTIRNHRHAKVFEDDLDAVIAPGIALSLDF